MYSAGMVASASSSNTQCPSGRCKDISACVAVSMQRSSVAAADVFSWINIAFSLLGPANEIGRAMPGADRPLDGRGQSGPGPVAGQEQIAPRRVGGGPLGVLVRRCGERRAPLAHDLPRRQLLGKTGNRRDLLPDFCS